MKETFHKISAKVSAIVGTPSAFIGALTVIIFWALSGASFGYSDTWQLAINTTTTIVTFLMVFIIQNTQNRDSKAVHIKLDELLDVSKGAGDRLVDVEDLPDDKLEQLQNEFKQLHEHYAKELLKRDKKTEIKEDK